jgi:hypothetical protein
MFVRLIRPLRHLLPLPWRIALKTSIRDRSLSRPVANRLLRWFTSPAADLRFASEDELPAPLPEEGSQNTPGPSPLLTIVVPFHNAGEFVMETLESLWAQTFADFEVIVVDDGSTDEASLAALRGVDEPRTRILHQDNRGLPAARNTGARAARGRHLCCIDADDCLRPSHLEKLLLALESRGCDLAHCDIQRFGQGEGVWRPAGFHAPALVRGNSLGNTAVAVMHLEAWRRAGGYCEALPGYQDWDFWISLAEAGCQAAHLPEPLFCYRRHGPSMIGRSARRHREIEAQIRARHQELFANPARAAALEGARRRQVARDPFVNLGPERMRPPASGHERVLLIVDRLDGSNQAAIEAQRAVPDIELRVLVTQQPSGDTPLAAEWDARGVPVYHVRPMMPPEHAPALAAHLARAHRAARVLRVEGDTLLPASDVAVR